MYMHAGSLGAYPSPALFKTTLQKSQQEIPQEPWSISVSQECSLTVGRVLEAIIYAFLFSIAEWLSALRDSDTP